jgi:hypothetical protein
MVHFPFRGCLRSLCVSLSQANDEATNEVGYRIGNAVLIIRQHPPTDDPNPRITLEVQDARETEKQLKEQAGSDE